MLSREDNELLTRTGPGTPMGNLFRRFWIPALLSEELAAPDCPPVRVTLMGEKLVAFRDSGKMGRGYGWPGPPNRKASEAVVKYILVDMYAQAIRGMKPEDAAKWAEAELKKAYA